MKHLSDFKHIFLTILLMLTVSYGYSQLPDPVAYWSMSGGSDTVIFGKYEAKLMNYGPEDSIYVKGKVGNAVKFDGDTNYVVAPTIPFTSGGEFTICFWMEIDTNGMVAIDPVNNNEISYYPFTTGTLASANSIRFRFLETKKPGEVDWLRFEVYDEDGTLRRAWCRPTLTASTHDDDMYAKKWMHVVGVNYADKSAIYLDNILSAESNAVTLNAFKDEGKTWIGTANLSNGVYHTQFKGKIDEVRLYNVALTAPQIDQIYHLTTPVAKLSTKKYKLEHYPNPFSDQTTISYTIKNAGKVKLEILNINGQLIKTLVNNEYQQLNTYEKTWDCRSDNGQVQSSGLYFYRLKVDDETVGVGKMMLIK